MSGVRIGVDTGGTFTDLMALDSEGRLRVMKVPSTPDDDTRAFLEGLAALCETGDFKPADVTSVGHGTTVALNAVLQGRWSPIGLLTTTGYRELIEVARQTVPGDWGAIYTWVKPPRVVSLEHVREVDGRFTYTGEEIVPLDEAGVRAQALWFKGRGINAVAISFVHSYASPTHERRARDIFGEVYPECFVTISSDILPEFREYERTMTTCLNAVLMPMVSEYLGNLTSRLEAAGYHAPLLMMKSVGGLSRADKVVTEPIYITYSGPSAGVLGMAWLADRIGEDKVLTYDMGGTSTDVALVEHGRPLLTTEGKIDSCPIKAPTIDLVSIGAGGGSIATLGTGNRLRVGPESAGSVPGPACYGRGGTQATVTDANLVLGRVGTELVGGGVHLDVDAARAAVQPIADALSLTLDEAAYGILELAAFNMAGAVREVSVKRGRDPREYALFPFGGAGPLHAAHLAQLLGISRIVTPANPGLGSCIGLLAADIRETGVQTYAIREDLVDFARLNGHVADLEAKTRDAVTDQGIAAATVVLERSADLRYVGMASELTVAVPDGALDVAGFGKVLDAFHAAHEGVYGYHYRGEQLVELVNLRVAATGPLASLVLAEQPLEQGDGAAAIVGERDVYFNPQSGRVRTRIYDRARLRAGHVIAGPAIVDQYDSTTLVPPGATALTDSLGNLVVTLG